MADKGLAHPPGDPTHPRNPVVLRPYADERADGRRVNHGETIHHGRVMCERCTDGSTRPAWWISGPSARVTVYFWGEGMGIGGGEGCQMIWSSPTDSPQGRKSQLTMILPNERRLVIRNGAVIPYHPHREDLFPVALLAPRVLRFASTVWEFHLIISPWHGVVVPTKDQHSSHPVILSHLHSARVVRNLLSLPFFTPATCRAHHCARFLPIDHLSICCVVLHHHGTYVVHCILVCMLQGPANL